MEHQDVSIEHSPGQPVGVGELSVPRPNDSGTRGCVREAGGTSRVPGRYLP